MKLKTTKMMLRRMKLKPRTLTPLVCSPIMKVHAAVGEAVAEGSVTDVREAQPGARSKIKFHKLESRMLALGNFLRFHFKKTDSQILSFPLSTIP